MLKTLLLLVIASTALSDSNLDEPNSDEMFDEDSMGNGFKDFVPMGDMLLTQQQYNHLYKQDPNKRVGFTVEFKRWPNALVPIKIKEGDFSPNFQRAIKAATQYIADRSCVRFLFDFDPLDYPDYVLVNIGEGKSCRSQVGNARNGVQQLQLHEKCTNGSIVHEMLHTLGFLHMHTAPNRDRYVRIVFEHIKPFALNNFNKASGSVGMFKTPYDFKSIMHYSQFAFAKARGQTTIQPKRDVAGMGQRIEMTNGDITRLNRMYKCPNFDDSIKGRTGENAPEENVEPEREVIDPSRQPLGLHSGNPMNTLKQFLKMATEGLQGFITPLCKLNQMLTMISKSIARI